MPANDFLSYASLAKVNASFNPELGRLTINGVPVDINQSGLQYTNGQLLGAQTAYDALLSPFTNNYAPAQQQVYEEMQDFQAYETPEEYRAFMLSLIEQANQKYQYDYNEDPMVAEARDMLEQSISGLAATHGFLYSGQTQNIIEAQMRGLTPAFEQAAYNRYKADLDLQMGFLQTLTKWDQMQYDRSMDKFTLIKTKADFLTTLSEMEFNRFKVMMNQYREEQQIKLSQEKFDLQKLIQDTENAYRRIENLGYVDNEAASSLGIPVGTKARWIQELEMEHRNKLELMAKENEYNLKMAEFQANVEKELVKYQEEVSVASKLRLMEQEFAYQSALTDLRYVQEKELAEIAAREKAAEEKRKADEKAAAEKAAAAEEAQYVKITWTDLKKRFQTKFDTDKDGYIDKGLENAAARWVLTEMGRGVRPSLLDQLIATYDIPEYTSTPNVGGGTTIYNEGFKKKAGVTVPKQTSR